MTFVYYLAFKKYAMRNASLVIVLVLLMSIQVLGQTKLSDLKAPFSSYIVSTTECSKIMHHSGSLIFIPSNAFEVEFSEVDVVTLLYRELRTPIQTLIHGINMTTELMGKSFYLQSNGMFEMYCLNGKDTVQVHEDRSIVVRLALDAKDIDVSMEGFSYNYKTRNWDSYTNRIQNLFLNSNDDDLWGSGMVSNNEASLENAESEWGDEWLVDSLWARQDSLRNLAFQTMEIFDFGLYNYDKIIDSEEFVPYVPQFVNQNNTAINTDVYVVYEGLNTVIYFREYNWKKNFTLIRDRKFSMFTVDDQGNIYKLKSYPKLEEPSSNVTFKLEKEGAIPDTEVQLSTLIRVR